MGRRPRPITIRGVEYPTRAAAAEALGVSVHAIENAVYRRRTHTVGLGIYGWRSMPVTIRGVRYRSMTAAAEALGVCKSTVSKAAKAGRLGAVGAERL